MKKRRGGFTSTGEEEEGRQRQNVWLGGGIPAHRVQQPQCNGRNQSECRQDAEKTLLFPAVVLCNQARQSNGRH